MRQITFVYSYYDNPRMFEEHIKIWQSYPGNIKNLLEFIVTDDCSPNHPASDVARRIKPYDIDLKIYRIQKDIPWNWRMARNVGAHHAALQWVLTTDMDHLIPVDTAEYITTANLDERIVYQFEREDAPNRTPYKPHNDSYLMTKQTYWKIGGYDEDFAGTYGTADWPPPAYGTKVKKIAKIIRLPVALVRYPREVVADSSCPRDLLILKGLENDKKKAEITAMKKRTGRGIMTLQSPYERVL